MLEIPEIIEVETNQNSHYFGTARLPLALVAFASGGPGQPHFSGFNVKFFAKIICNTEDFRNFVSGDHRL